MAAITRAPVFTRDVTLKAASSRFALSAIVLLGAAAIYGFGLLANRPITFPDEAVYTDLARHLGVNGTFRVAGASFPALTFGPLYAVLLAPIFKLAGTTYDAYLAARGLNALLFTSAAVPIYLIARRVVAERTALVVAAAGIALPASVYTTKLQTESLAYPLMLWCVVAALGVLSQPSQRRQFALLLALCAAPLVRFELLVLGPALAAGCLACTPGQIRIRVRRLLPLLAGVLTVVIGAGILLVVTSRRAGPQGTHGSDLHTFSLSAFAKLLVGSIGVLDLYTGVLPFAVFVLFLVGRRVVPRAPWIAGDARRIAVLTAWSGVGLAVIGSLYLAAIPASFRPPAPAERYTFYVVPLVLTLFARWIECGAPELKSKRWIFAAVATLPVVVAVVSLSGAGPAGNSSSLALMPWIALRNLFSGPWWLIVLGAYCGVCAVRGMRPRVATDSLLKPVVTLLPVTTACAFIFVITGSNSARGLAPAPGWLDAHSNSAVAAVWLRRPTPARSFALWETEAMNKNLARVYYVKRPDLLGAQFELKVGRGSDGSLIEHRRPLSYKYVLTSSDTPVVGHLVSTSHGLSLYRVHFPVRFVNQGSDVQSRRR